MKPRARNHPPPLRTTRCLVGVDPLAASARSCLVDPASEPSHRRPRGSITPWAPRMTTCRCRWRPASIRHSRGSDTTARREQVVRCHRYDEPGSEARTLVDHDDASESATRASISPRGSSAGMHDRGPRGPAPGDAPCPCTRARRHSRLRASARLHAQDIDD